MPDASNKVCHVFLQFLHVSLEVVQYAPLRKKIAITKKTLFLGFVEYWKPSTQEANLSHSTPAEIQKRNELSNYCMGQVYVTTIHAFERKF